MASSRPLSLRLRRRVTDSLPALLVATALAGACDARPAAEAPPGTPSPDATASEALPDLPEADRTAVLALVERFGRRLASVPLLAPDEQVRQALREQYGPLVTPELLAAWLAAPASAPGRAVSSP